jgi:hypothetical protein
MDESIKFFVGLDTHKDSIAVAMCTCKCAVRCPRLTRGLLARPGS